MLHDEDKGRVGVSDTLGSSVSCTGVRSVPTVMGIVNVTPDSFSDGGHFQDPDKAIEQGLRLVAEGASILDVGGESTRPGAKPVSLKEELARVIPVIRELAASTDARISVDTCKTDVMQAAIEAGATLVNDINALQAPGALETVASCQAVSVCLMHKQGTPQTMQHSPAYQDVVSDVKRFLLARAELCFEAGIDRERIWLDPGIGFGKHLEHNLALLTHLDELVATGLVVLLGVSRKSLIGDLLNRPVDQRLAGSLALVAHAMIKGVGCVRVHDVRETVDLIRMLSAVSSA